MREWEVGGESSNGKAQKKLDFSVKQSKWDDDTGEQGTILRIVFDFQASLAFSNTPL